MSAVATSITPKWEGDGMLNPTLPLYRGSSVDNSASYVEPEDADSDPCVLTVKSMWASLAQTPEEAIDSSKSSTNSIFARRQQGLSHGIHLLSQYCITDTRVLDTLSDERPLTLTQPLGAVEQYYIGIIRTLVGPYSFKEMVASLNYQGFGKCAERLIYLQSTDDLEEGDEPLALESVQGFFRLMRDFCDLGEPFLGLFPEGTLSVEWRIADDKHLLIEPLDSENASFALIGPSAKRGDKFRLNGRGKIADIINTLQKNSVTQWGNM